MSADAPLDCAQFIGKFESQRVSYRVRDLLLYAAGISAQKPNFSFEHADGFSAFPTFPLVLKFRGNADGIVDFPSGAMMAGAQNPPLDGVKFGLDGERSIEILKRLPTAPLSASSDNGGDEDEDLKTDPKIELELRSRIVGVHKRGSGASVETEALLVDPASGDVYCRMTSGAFLVGADNFVDAGETFSEKVAVPAGEPDCVDEVPVRPDQAVLYRLSGDYNPLHIDPDMAKMNGFKAPILHGLCSLGMSTNALLERHAGGDPDRFRQVKMRFAAPVLPGQTLVVESWKAAADRIVFQVKVKETGKVCINNAYMLLHPEGGASKL